MDGLLQIWAMAMQKNLQRSREREKQRSREAEKGARISFNQCFPWPFMSPPKSKGASMALLLCVRAFISFTVSDKRDRERRWSRGGKTWIHKLRSFLKKIEANFFDSIDIARIWSIQMASVVCLIDPYLVLFRFNRSAFLCRSDRIRFPSVNSLPHRPAWFYSDPTSSRRRLALIVLWSNVIHSVPH